MVVAKEEEVVRVVVALVVEIQGAEKGAVPIVEVLVTEAEVSQEILVAKVNLQEVEAAAPEVQAEVAINPTTQAKVATVAEIHEVATVEGAEAANVKIKNWRRVKLASNFNLFNKLT